MLYRPSAVFKKFSFIHLLDKNETCACTSVKRLQEFCDSLTDMETAGADSTSTHVRMMDLNIVQHKELRSALSQGLNHIPLQSTCIAKTMACIMQAFDQLIIALNLDRSDFPTDNARTHLYSTCLNLLKSASRTNRFGLRHSGKWLFDNDAVKNEMEWLLKHLYCSGLDKASNNACFMYIRHIRLLAFERLSGSDFSPCMTGSFWSLPASILYTVSNNLEEILPECPLPYKCLPFLMATFKQHKNKYRWLTNAYCTIFSNIALLLTITSNLIMESFKEWALVKLKDFQKFLQVRTSIFWIVDSIIDTMVNLPVDMHDIFVADIS